MIQVNHPGDPRILSLKVTGQVNGEYHDIILPMMIRALEKEGSLNLMIELMEDGGFDLRSLVEYLLTDAADLPGLDRIAILAGQTLATRMSQHEVMMNGVEVRYFQPTELEKAKTWLTTNDLEG